MTLRERQPPPRSGWIEVETPLQVRASSLAASSWVSGPVRVISTLIVADLPDGSGAGEQWHVSIARKNKRPKPTDVRRALRALGLVGAEEDNHHPGNARHFFLPVDPAKRGDCECKTTETVIVQDDGYRFTTPKDGPCSGCSLEEITGKSCMIHKGAA